jgi:hypothetical protein
LAVTVRQEERPVSCPLDKAVISWRISSTRQTVHRAESLIGFGKRPDLTPSHQLVLPMGITLSTCGRRRNPVSGISYISKPHFFSTSDCTIADLQMSRRKRVGAGFSVSGALPRMLVGGVGGTVGPAAPRPRPIPRVAEQSGTPTQVSGEAVKGRLKKCPVMGQHDQHDQVTLW